MKFSNIQRVNNAWSQCFKLCLEALTYGSLGISAVILNEKGDIISQGRNQIFDNYESCNAIKNSCVSHAEINALANLPEEYKNKKGLTLFTTVEPCPMCMGAIVMSSIRDVMIASCDPWAGSVRLLEKDWYLSQKKIQVQYATGIVEQLFFILHLIKFHTQLTYDKRSHFLLMFEDAHPRLYSQSKKLYANKYFMDAIHNGDEEKILEYIKSCQ